MIHIRGACFSRAAVVNLLIPNLFSLQLRKYIPFPDTNVDYITSKKTLLSMTTNLCEPRCLLKKGILYVMERSL